MPVLDIKTIYHPEKCSTFSGYALNYIIFNYKKIKKHKPSYWEKFKLFTVRNSNYLQVYK